MSLVRYTNKKTGWVSIYESTSCYDPVTKTSKPKRKYIGHEDPVTKEFIPSSGKSGRKKQTQAKEGVTEPTNTVNKYKQALEELAKQRDENKRLSNQVQTLTKELETLRRAIAKFVESVK